MSDMPSGGGGCEGCGCGDCGGGVGSGASAGGGGTCRAAASGAVGGGVAARMYLVVDGEGIAVRFLHREQWLPW
ncbi:hypothetical protein, partial [Streptomyces griseoaurantiacus]|uniref:hypothetical protein n=1 Tax=Streptomyces griseoaurantiacus TaxID=68213 RepID=UPI00296E8CE4